MTNLRVVIVDEMSLVLYQLHFRLMNVIFPNNSNFGVIAVFVMGDILQIDPVKGSPIYGEPREERLKLCHVLWKIYGNNLLWLT